MALFEFEKHLSIPEQHYIKVRGEYNDNLILARADLAARNEWLPCLSHQEMLDSSVVATNDFYNPKLFENPSNRAFYRTVSLDKDVLYGFRVIIYVRHTLAGIRAGLSSA